MLHIENAITDDLMLTGTLKKMRAELGTESQAEEV
mgnify:FL=1